MRTACLGQLKVKYSKTQSTAKHVSMQVNNIPCIVINSIVVFELFVHAILPSAIAWGIDCVEVKADALVPLMAAMADLRRLKDSRQCSHHMVVEFGWPLLLANREASLL